mmetsp:Transcript_5973/g.19739  ORF Transcript_5973/g.19739 Transcript_5973/m.19739 type:complete len:225 (-) Transcript_5973:1397-2071(-)
MVKLRCCTARNKLVPELRACAHGFKTRDVGNCQDCKIGKSARDLQDARVIRREKNCCSIEPPGECAHVLEVILERRAGPSHPTPLSSRARISVTDVHADDAHAGCERPGEPRLLSFSRHIVLQQWRRPCRVQQELRRPPEPPALPVWRWDAGHRFRLHKGVVMKIKHQGQGGMLELTTQACERLSGKAQPRRRPFQPTPPQLAGRFDLNKCDRASLVNAIARRC